MKILNDTITSRQNPLVKWAASLSEKKCREAESSFIAEGEKLCFEAAKSELPVTHVFVSENRKDKIYPLVLEEMSGNLCIYLIFL